MDPGAPRAHAGRAAFDADRKRHILQQITEAEGLERFLHTKYVGQKRFSLEGEKASLPRWTRLCTCGENGIQEIVVGMAHRGRLNMLVNIMGKMPGDLFAEFEGKHAKAYRWRREIPQRFLQ